MENRRPSTLVCFVILVLILTMPITAVSQTIKVGASVALTGGYAAGGKDVKAGYELAVKHINEDGGIFVKEYNKNFLWSLSSWMMNPIQLRPSSGWKDSVAWIMSSPTLAVSAAA